MPAGMAIDQVERAGTPRTEPKEIVTILHRPNHRLFQIAFRAELAAGPLARMWKTLNDMGIHVLSTSMTSKDGVLGSFEAFVDSADYGITAGAIRPKLESLPNMRDVRVTEGGELIVNELFFPLVDSAGNRVMVITKEAFQMMLAALGTAFGTGEGVVAYLEGRAIGSSSAASLRSMTPANPTKFAAELTNLYMATGVGVCETIELTVAPMRIVLQFTDNIECKGRHTEKPNSQWLRGHLVGGISTMLDTPMECREVKCVSQGDRYCVFELTKSDGC